jgi:hypothetical protein
MNMKSHKHKDRAGHTARGASVTGLRVSCLNANGKRNEEGHNSQRNAISHPMSSKAGLGGLGGVCLGKMGYADTISSRDAYVTRAEVESQFNEIGRDNRPYDWWSEDSR